MDYYVISKEECKEKGISLEGRDKIIDYLSEENFLEGNIKKLVNNSILRWSGREFLNYERAPDLINLKCTDKFTSVAAEAIHSNGVPKINQFILDFDYPGTAAEIALGLKSRDSEEVMDRLAIATLDLVTEAFKVYSNKK